MLVTLGGLLADARLRLYAGCGTLVATSDRAGTQFEEIQHGLRPGTYRIVIDAVEAVPATTAYDLRVRFLPGRVFVLSSRAWVEGPNLRIVGEVLNDTRRVRGPIVLRFVVYDSSGEVIPPFDWRTVARRELLGPGQRATFVFDYAGVPVDYDHFGVVVDAAPVATDQSAGRLAVRRGTTTTDESGTRHFTGTVENRNPFPVTRARVFLALYDAWGRLLNADDAPARAQRPGPLAAAESSSFEIALWSHWATASRVDISSEGYRIVAPVVPVPAGSRARTD